VPVHEGSGTLAALATHHVTPSPRELVALGVGGDPKRRTPQRDRGEGGSQYPELKTVEGCSDGA